MLKRETRRKDTEYAEKHYGTLNWQSRVEYTRQLTHIQDSQCSQYVSKIKRHLIVVRALSVPLWHRESFRWNIGGVVSLGSARYMFALKGALKTASTSLLPTASWKQTSRSSQINTDSIARLFTYMCQSNREIFSCSGDTWSTRSLSAGSRKEFVEYIAYTRSGPLHRSRVHKSPGFTTFCVGRRGG